jgi:hypothetical protein
VQQHGSVLPMCFDRGQSCGGFMQRCLRRLCADGAWRQYRGELLDIKREGISYCNTWHGYHREIAWILQGDCMDITGRLICNISWITGRLYADTALLSVAAHGFNCAAIATSASVDTSHTCLFAAAASTKGVQLRTAIKSQQQTWLCVLELTHCTLMACNCINDVSLMSGNCVVIDARA